MNSKMTTNSQLSTNEPKKRKSNEKKKKLSKQLEQEQNQRNGHHMEGFQWGGRGEEQGRKGTGKKKHNWQALNRWGEVKNGIGNREVKELVCTTHGHELRRGECWRVGGVKGGEIKGKNWENCNSIINKI